jgi:RNA polymerase sigma factor (sigma-70 family)
MNILSPYKGLSDLDLWRLFLQGNEQAFAAIFELYSAKLYRYGNAITPHGDIVEDSIQDIFIELWHSRTRLKDTDNIRFYLFKVLRRKIYRNLNNRIDLTDDFTDKHFDNDVSIETLIIDHENQTNRLKMLANAIKQLPPRQREVIELRFYQGFSYEHIAELTEINLQSVHNNMHRALTVLRQNLSSNLLFVLVAMTPSVF